MTRHRLLAYATVLSSILWMGSCAFILDTIRTGGEKELKPAPPPASGSGPRMIIFALDGTTPAQLMEAIRSGKAPNLARQRTGSRLVRTWLRRTEGTEHSAVEHHSGMVRDLHRDSAGAQRCGWRRMVRARKRDVSRARAGVGSRYRGRDQSGNRRSDR